VGAQTEDPEARYYDPKALPDEALQEVQLGPFLLARHEITRGQWERLGGGSPSRLAYGTQHPGMRSPINDAHPVDTIDRFAAKDLLHRHALQLPTEAQWEYACRASTTTPWHCGSTPADLAGFANLLDQHAKQFAPNWSGEPAPFEDGFVLHAPVGSFKSNAWGMHDMHGNVYEWCRDDYSDQFAPLRRGDGLRLGAQDTATVVGVYRGGSFPEPADKLRCARRNRVEAGTRNMNVGVRAARAIQAQR
jgi:formylglycine-generating enzyme required for sulfatase activity